MADAKDIEYAADNLYSIKLMLTRLDNEWDELTERKRRNLVKNTLYHVGVAESWFGDVTLEARVAKAAAVREP